MPHMGFPACLGQFAAIIHSLSDPATADAVAGNASPRGRVDTGARRGPSPASKHSSVASNTDGIDYLLVQFVDIHGSAKVKMVPAECLDAVADSGAGFAGGAVWGMGQNAASHDMMARIDPATYTPLPWKPGLARFAADLYVDGQPHPVLPARQPQARARRAARRRATSSTSASSRSISWSRATADGRIVPWDPAGVDTLAKPCYDFKGLAAACDFLRDMNDALHKLGWGVYQSDHEDANGQYEINFQLRRRPDHGRPLHLLQDAGRRDGAEVRGHRHVHGQAVRRPHRQRRAHALPPGRRRDRHEPVRRRARPARPRPVASWRITSSAASWPTPAPCAPSRRRRSTATSGCRSARA